VADVGFIAFVGEPVLYHDAKVGVVFYD